MGSTPWFLESMAADGARVTHRIERLPFSVGRDAGNDLAIESAGLSRRHAELRADEHGGLLIVDLGSTNGTFVNRERLTAPRRLQANDILHFCTAEFRLTHDEVPATGPLAEPPSALTRMVSQNVSQLSQNFVRHEAQFLEFLAGRGMAAAAQPIVDAHGGQLRAYELLGRCAHPELPGSPMHLFMMAAALRREAERLRAQAITEGRERGLAAVSELMVAARASAARAQRNVQGDLRTLAVRIAERILDRELSLNPDAVSDIVAAALRQAGAPRDIVLRVHPDDLKALERGRPRLLERALRAQALQFRADPSIGRGGCIVESELGTVDARLPVQLEAIERALRGGG